MEKQNLTIPFPSGRKYDIPFIFVPAVPGTCYPSALEFARANKEQGWIIVHGLIEGEGHVAGEPLAGHAWVELDLAGETLVHDPSSPDEQDPKFGMLCEKQDYYTNNCVIDEVRYTLPEAEQLAKEHGSPGPWDENIKRKGSHGRTRYRFDRP